MPTEPCVIPVQITLIYSQTFKSTNRCQAVRTAMWWLVSCHNSSKFNNHLLVPEADVFKSFVCFVILIPGVFSWPLYIYHLKSYKLKTMRLVTIWSFWFRHSLWSASIPTFSNQSIGRQGLTYMYLHVNNLNTISCLLGFIWYRNTTW